MPKLIVNRSGRRKVPPCGRLIEYREAHSPFQKLIDSERKRCGFSVRELAKKIGVSQSTLWIWLHSRNGYPHPKAFRPEHLQRLSQVLKIPEIKIGAALDGSRHLFTPRENPMPHEAFDAFGQFIEILKNDKRRTVSKSYVLNVARNLYRGAKVTLLILLATAGATLADDLVSTKGQRFERVTVTEVTPATIAFKHAHGFARMPLTDFPADVQQRYGYDAVQAQSWLVQQARAEQDRQQREAATAAAKAGAAEREKAAAKARANAVQAEIEQMREWAGAVYDPSTRRYYRNRDEALAARWEALKAARADRSELR